MEPTGLTWLGLALALLGPGVVASLSVPPAGKSFSLVASVPWLCVFVLLVLAVAVLARYGEKLTWAQVGLGRISWWSIPAGIALALCFIFLFGPIASWILELNATGSWTAGQRSLTALPTWYLVVTVVVVASGEEWLYRGYALERLQAITGRAWLAGLVSLLAFGLVHFPLWGITVALTTVVSGGILTALYIWRRDVSFLILAHVLTDLYGLIIAR